MWYFRIIYCITHTYNHSYIACFSNTLFENVIFPKRTSASTYASARSNATIFKTVTFSSRRLSQMKWNESGFRPPLCTYRLNWARRTSWGWWDDWDDTVLQTQNSKFEPWRSEAEHATSRSRRLPTILTLTRGWGRNIYCFFQTAETGTRTPNSGVKGSGANHNPRAPAHPIIGMHLNKSVGLIQHEWYNVLRE